MITQSQLSDALTWRFATKKFNQTKVSEDLLSSVLEAGRLAPTSYGLQPVKVWVISNDEIRERLRAVGYNQPQITDSSHLIVLASKLDLSAVDVDAYMERIHEVREVPVSNLAGFKEMILGDITRKGSDGANHWAARQAYITLGFMLEAAALLNVDACPMEGFDNAGFDSVLGLTEMGYASRVIMALGYRDSSDETAPLKKVRKAIDEFAVRM